MKRSKTFLALLAASVLTSAAWADSTKTLPPMARPENIATGADVKAVLVVAIWEICENQQPPTKATRMICSLTSADMIDRIPDDANPDFVWAAMRWCGNNTVIYDEDYITAVFELASCTWDRFEYMDRTKNMI